MGVSTDYIQHNQTNQMLLNGARKLGYAHSVVPQNTGGKEHSCGHCTFGCGSSCSFLVARLGESTLSHTLLKDA